MYVETGGLPDMPVHRRQVPVDVFDDGSFKVGKLGYPSEGALFQFSYEALFVACGEDFHPCRGGRAVTMYRGSQQASSRELRTGDKLYHVELHGDEYDGGPPSPYVLCVTEQVKNPAERVTVRVAEVYSVYRQVMMELTRRGYRRVWAK